MSFTQAFRNRYSELSSGPLFATKGEAISRWNALLAKEWLRLSTSHTITMHGDEGRMIVPIVDEETELDIKGQAMLTWYRVGERWEIISYIT
tara:strand:+ start:109 stop:384 length:276 start_codon:yes stop_codon:yes gene_type:complete